MPQWEPAPIANHLYDQDLKQKVNGGNATHTNVPPADHGFYNAEVQGAMTSHDSTRNGTTKCALVAGHLHLRLQL
jgi:hypothetical protein